MSRNLPRSRWSGLTSSRFIRSGLKRAAWGQAAPPRPPRIVFVGAALSVVAVLVGWRAEIFRAPPSLVPREAVAASAPAARARTSQLSRAPSEPVRPNGLRAAPDDATLRTWAAQ